MPHSSITYMFFYMLAALLGFRLWKLNAHILPQQLRHSALPVLNLVVDAALLYTLTLLVTLICLLVNTNAMAIMIELVRAHPRFRHPGISRSKASSHLHSTDRPPHLHNLLRRHHPRRHDPLLALYFRHHDRRKRHPQHRLLSPTHTITACVLQGRCEPKPSQSQLPRT